MYPGAHAATTPDKPAVVMSDTGRVVTYRQLEDRSAALAFSLHELGLRTGDVLAMLSTNEAECFEIYWAAIRSGLYVVAINHHLTPDEIAYVVDDSDAEVLIASASLSSAAEAVVASTPRVRHRFVVGGAARGHRPYEELVDGVTGRLGHEPRGSDMLYSSGTTGRPKGIKAPLRPITVDQPGDPVTGLLGAAFGLSTDDVYLSAAPIYHAAPLRWCGAVHAFGGTVVMMPRFDAEAALAAIERFAVTVLQMVPTMFVRLLQLPPAVRDLHSHRTLRLAVHAAAPCPPDVKQAMIDWWGPILTEYYSSTEASGFTIITTEEWLDRRGSVGRSVLGTIHVCDDAGRPVPAGEVGTVYFERDARPFEYHKDPDRTRDAEHPEHPSWTAIGDLGYVDDDGYLFLTDRAAFMIISGGVNIYPQEVENALTLHPAVFDVAVVGLPDPEMGQRVTAFVQLRDGHEPSEATAADIIASVRARIAAFKAPRDVVFVDALPRTATGKLVKRRLLDAAPPTTGALT